MSCYPDFFFPGLWSSWKTCGVSREKFKNKGYFNKDISDSTQESSYPSKIRRISAVPVSKLGFEYSRYSIEDYKLLQKSTNTEHLTHKNTITNLPHCTSALQGDASQAQTLSLFQPPLSPVSSPLQQHLHFWKRSGWRAAFCGLACKVKQPQALVSSQEHIGMWWVRRWAVPTVGTEEQTQGTAPLVNHSSHLEDINAQITLKRGWGWDLGWYCNLI